MIITREQIKTYLGIATADHDAAIDAILPIVDAKVKEITRRHWNDIVSARIDGTVFVEIRTRGSDFFSNSYLGDTDSIGVKWAIERVQEFIEPGTQVSGDGIPAGAYITDIYTNRVSTYTAPVAKISSAATASGTIDLELGFPISYHPTVAKLAWWLINDKNTNSPSASVQSKSLGDVSVTYDASSSMLDGKFGVPRWAIVGLPRYGRGY